MSWPPSLAANATQRADEGHPVLPTAKSEVRGTPEGWAQASEDVPLVVLYAEEAVLTTTRLGA